MPVSLGWTADRALTALLDALDEGALVFDERQTCKAAGRRVAELLGGDARSLIGLHRHELVERIAAIAVASSADAVRALHDETVRDGRTVADPIEILGAHPRIIAWTSVPIEDRAGVIGRIDILRDVTRERRAEQDTAAMARRLSLASIVDELTGLMNRRRFDEECQREHRRSQRAWAPYALARVDVDGMAQINATHGREKGDELLARVAEELKSTRREYDLVARFIDDELVLLLPGCDARIGKKVLRRAVAAAAAKGSEVVGATITLSTGVAIWTPPSGELPADLVERAGVALLAARARGPGSLEIDVDAAEWKDDSTSET
jgi:diguanylate cyclase (GGDEF)-like protein